MTNFGWNFPPGVTGNEFAIAGPDREWETTCAECDAPAAAACYDYHWWTDCENGHHHDYDYGPDPDEEYDRMRDDALTEKHGHD
jgi:hypothetical protein